MTDTPRLIEYAFPLKQASLDSVHEKNVRHGHISTLHIWPARRPLAACRAALIATLLPDPGTPEGRQELCEKIGGKVVKKIQRKKMPGGRVVEREKEETEGGILHWKRETENAETLEWFRQEIRKAYGGRAPKVLDPFAGGGAIPLEAMRLGCEATAIDINPVAWFILKCTLEYPQKLAGQKRPLPDFILKDRAFMAEFFKKAQRMGRAEIRSQLKRLGVAANEDQQSFDFDKAKDVNIEADLAWHVRAWGQWVLDRARRELAEFYPTYADFEPLAKDVKSYERQPMRLVPLKEDGTPDIDALNAEFSDDYLEVKSNPRWVAKPTVAYLWARTVTCKNCRAMVPLLKTRWLCKKANKRVLLRMDLGEVGQMMDRRQVGQASVPAPEGQLKITRRRLPHWRLEGATYFVTWRLHHNQAPLNPEERSLVLEAIQHFNGQRYELAAWVVMDDHIHVIVRPRTGHELSGITHSWKSFTANRLQREHARQGALWQDESWDRIIRDEDEFLEKAQYILNNPVKRWPDLQEYSWVGFQDMAGTEVCPTRQEESCPTKKEVLAGGAGVPAGPWSTKQVVFGIQTDVPVKGGNAAQRREHDKRIGAGTMSRAGAKCPCCGTIMTMEDLRAEGKAGRLGTMPTAVVVDGPKGKEYRLPTEHELAIVAQASVPGSGSQQTQAGTEACPTITQDLIQQVFADIPFGLPTEPTPAGGGRGAGRAFSVQGYGLMRWCDLFTPRQLAALGTFVKHTRAARDAMRECGYLPEWIVAVAAYLASMIDRLANQNSTETMWNTIGEKVEQTFARFALPIHWDHPEANVLSDMTGGYTSALQWVGLVTQHLLEAASHTQSARALAQSAIDLPEMGVDLIVTDPPYYDAIPYSDLMDFFYVWLRRSVRDLDTSYGCPFALPLGPKWNVEDANGELIDDDSRHDGDAARSKAAYEDGMARSFSACHRALVDDGRLVIVFAHKQPDAWETLVSAIIRAGFVVDGSWPIVTEMRGGVRNFNRASLASSVWLVCNKRPVAARPGWDNAVLDEMRSNIKTKLRDFWDAGIRGPDFVWAATGPALEAYSKHPVVKKANEPGPMTVSEFLTHVRRMVVDFVVGRVLSGDGDEGGDASADRLDEPTSYYLLHRHDFGFEEAPAGTCILYAVSCGLSDRELVDSWNLLSRSGGSSTATAEEEETDPDSSTETDGGSGSKLKLKTWAQRKNRTMGYEAPGGRPVPLIDQVHRLMHLWRGGDVHKVDEYLGARSFLGDCYSR